MSNFNKLLREAVSEKETRTYKITGPSEQLDLLERVLSHVDYACTSGSSAEITIFIDGDGAASLKCQTDGGKGIPGNDISNGHGKAIMGNEDDLKVSIGD